MKKILVPCDFSKLALNAFRLALDMAKQSKGIVHLLNVIEMPVMHDTILMPTLNFEEELFKEMAQKSAAEFIKIIQKYNTEEVKVVSKVEFGTPRFTILEYAAREAVDIIVMGSHGATGVREVFVGSNAEKIVRNSKVPVLVVKDFFKGPVTDIVFPNTLALENQEDMIMKVKAMQHFFDAKLHILWVNTPFNFTSDDVTLERLSSFAKRYMLKNFTLHIFNDRNEEAGILKFTEMIHANMIAMATHGRKGLAHIMNGSVAEDVVNHADKLIWTYTLNNEAVEAN